MFAYAPHDGLRKNHIAMVQTPQMTNLTITSAKQFASNQNLEQRPRKSHRSGSSTAWTATPRSLPPYLEAAQRELRELAGEISTLSNLMIAFDCIVAFLLVLPLLVLIGYGVILNCGACLRFFGRPNCSNLAEETSQFLWWHTKTSTDKTLQLTRQNNTI